MLKYTDKINQFWYKRHPLRWFLAPLSVLYWMVAVIRRSYLTRIKQTHFGVPIIVVGNLTLGGAGKTPLVISLANALKAKGLRVGIVSRGYGARGPFPRMVTVMDNALYVGDEPLLIAKKTACSVVVAPKRVDAVNYLMRHVQPQVILSDDGLQHYAMGRAIEIVVIDGERRLGNGLLFPAGPLREGPSRLATADFVVINGGEWPNAYRMNLVCGEITALKTGVVIKATELNETVAAVAAIGNPERFYSTLSQFNVIFNRYSFADHFPLSLSDLIFKEQKIIMTEKDAVKCEPFATDDMYFLPVTAELSHDFWAALWEHKQLKEVLSA